MIKNTQEPTNYMEQNPPSEDNSQSTGQEYHCFLQNSKFH